MSLNIVFHGRNAATFHEGFAELLTEPHSISVLPDVLADDAMRTAYREADVVIGTGLDAGLPHPERLRLFQVAGAGTDLVNTQFLPAGSILCNCYGHDVPIAEYVMTAILNSRVPIRDADQRLRQRDWTYQSGRQLHGEIAGEVVGLVGYGHIGRTIAKCASAFGMHVHVANRSKVPVSDLVEQSFDLGAIQQFLAGVDYVVVALPHTSETEGLIGSKAFAAMRPNAYLCNVGRGPVVDEKALFDALKEGRIRGAAVDTWYVYPSATDTGPSPGVLPFETLPNLTMTPHMSGWTHGTIDRRRRAMADNVNRLARHEMLQNIVFRAEH